MKNIVARHVKEIFISRGCTLNMGNYESERYDIGVGLDTEKALDQKELDITRGELEI